MKIFSGPLLALSLLLLAAPSAFAQVTTGSTLRGVIQDPAGGAVPNVAVRLVSTERGDERQATTSDEGTYVFPSVAPGLYTLRVEAQGFKTYEQTGLRLAPSETRGLDVTLEVGGAAETVTVSAAEATQIQTETGERSNTITAAQIENLSIIGRSSLELLRTLPGVVAQESDQLDVVSFGGGGNASANYTVNGIRGVNNNISIDGSRVIDIGSNNGTIITPNNDMVQEVTVKSSNYAAEYGSGGVQISATTKGGGKDFHGTLYYYGRPNALRSNNRANTTFNQPKPETSFHYPGGNIGGPILLPFTDFNRNRDKLFFFVGYEVQRQTVAADTRFGIVPTAAERSGNFSQSTSSFGSVNGVPRICPPSTFNFSPCATPTTNLTGFANPIGVALLGLYPLPNFTPAPGTAAAASGFNYTVSPSAPTNRTDFKTRIDYNVTDNTRAYLRLAREAETADSPYGIWWGPSTYELPSPVRGTNLGRSAALNVTSVLSPTMTNEVVFSASKLQLYYDFADPSKLTKQSLGIQNLQLPFQTSTPYAPLALISWDVGSQLWEPGNLPLFANNSSYSVTDTLSKITGNHTLKFGVLLEQANKQQNTAGPTEGQVEFEAGNQPRTTGNAFANLYTGQINSITQSSDRPIGDFRFWNLELFAQDSWKVRPRLTFEYGVRMSYFPNNYERKGLGVAFDPRTYVRNAGSFINGDPQRPNGLVTAASGAIPKGIIDNPAPKFAPRLNLAWDVFGNASTVLRGGVGLFYNRVQGNYQYGVTDLPPNTFSTSANAWGGGGVQNNDLTLSNLGTINPFTALGGFDINAVDVSNPGAVKIPQTTTASVTLERRLPFNNVGTVAYVGTFGRHLPQVRGVNYIFPGSVPATLGNANLANAQQRYSVFQNEAARRQLLPYPDLGRVALHDFSGTSNYHSMQATLSRQLGANLQYYLTYTFSKALGTTSTNETGGADLDPVDVRGRIYGILPYDRTHIFNASYNYNFPDVARGSFSNWLTRGLLNGWQMSGITTFESGRPMNVRFSGALSGDSPAVIFAALGNTAFSPNGQSRGAGGIAPIFTRNPATGAQGVGESYLDLSAIQIPTFGQTGPYQSPFYIRSPRRSNFDFTFFKNFNFTEEKRLQFRVGIFNAFNQAFPNPDLGDINLLLETDYPRDATGRCLAIIPAGTPNGTGTTDQEACDPAGGFVYSQRTLNSFGRIINKHGTRRVELAVKFYF